MEPIGKRPYYVIIRVSSYDDTNGDIVFLTSKRSEAIDRFNKYYDLVRREFDEEDGNTENAIHITDRPATPLKGNFYFWDDDGSFNAYLIQIKSNCFLRNGEIDWQNENWYRDLEH